jgi:hypothetical protein
MATKSSWAAAILVAGCTFIAAACRTAPEKPSASSGSAEGSGTMGTATTEQPTRSAEGGQAGASPQSRSSETARAGTGATPYEVTGRVEKVEKSNIQIAGKLLKVDSSTSISKGGVGATLAEVKEGDEVRATLSGSGDPPKAARIEVITATDNPPATGNPPESGKPPESDKPPESGEAGTYR